MRAGVAGAGQGEVDRGQERVFLPVHPSQTFAAPTAGGSSSRVQTERDPLERLGPPAQASMASTIRPSLPSWVSARAIISQLGVALGEGDAVPAPVRIHPAPDPARRRLHRLPPSSG